MPAGLIPQHSQKRNLFAKYAAVICCHFLHITESDSPDYNLSHNSARAGDAMKTQCKLYLIIPLR